MAVVQSRGASRRISGINVTPLVDITLVLLVVFMVTAKVAVTQALPLDLPSAGQAKGVQVIYSVKIDAKGQLWVDGEALSGTAQLVNHAKQALAQDKSLRAVIAADGGVAHRQVMAVLDALSKAGVAQVAFAAKGNKEGA